MAHKAYLFAAGATQKGTLPSRAVGCHVLFPTVNIIIHREFDIGILNSEKKEYNKN